MQFRRRYSASTLGPRSCGSFDETIISKFALQFIVIIISHLQRNASRNCNEYRLTGKRRKDLISPAFSTSVIMHCDVDVDDGAEDECPLKFV